MRIGYVGWRGMVGSVLMSRMKEEGDFNHGHKNVFFSTSQVGKAIPANLGDDNIYNANSIEELARCDIIVTCQGGDWTRKIFPKLEEKGWKGIFIDASSALRMDAESLIVLDPINKDSIIKSVKDGKKIFCGGNCTVSLMLMALHGLFKENLVTWINSDTYQAASGAGAKNMHELIQQLEYVSKGYDPSLSAIELDKLVSERIRSSDLPRENFRVPLALSLIPWIDRLHGNGYTKEEFKGYEETNKILGLKEAKISIDGICVRIGAMRCHSQALTIKLRSNIPIEKIKEIIAHANEFVSVIDNNEEDTINFLTPAAVTGTNKIAIGRIRASRLGTRIIHAFMVGDQLLWGAAEPIRRALRIIIENL